MQLNIPIDQLTQFLIFLSICWCIVLFVISFSATMLRKCGEDKEFVMLFALGAVIFLVNILTNMHFLFMLAGFVMIAWGSILALIVIRLYGPPSKHAETRDPDT